jgi:hypothetical protein
MKLDEGVAEDDRHFIDVASVSPVRVVNGGESDFVLRAGKRKVSFETYLRRESRQAETYLASECSHHHVSSIERVNEVGRERGRLRSRVDFRGNRGVSDEDGLKGRRNLYFRNQESVAAQETEPTVAFELT